MMVENKTTVQSQAKNKIKLKGLRVLAVLLSKITSPLIGISPGVRKIMQMKVGLRV